MTPEINLRIAELRAKSAQGELTLEEQKEAIVMLRQGRISAAAASENSKRKSTKKPVRSGEDLLADLMGGDLL